MDLSSPTTWCAFLLVGVVLAGCANGPRVGDDAVQEGEDRAVTEGADHAVPDGSATLRGLVVDAAIRPMPEVNVTIKRTTTAVDKTGPDGMFRFTDLAPGLYVVSASRLGYFDAQTTVSLHEGEESPIVKLVLDPDIATMPYVQSQVAEGFIECSTSVVQVCGNGNAASDIACGATGVCAGNVTSGQYDGHMMIAGNASLLQFELIWTPTQSLGTNLLLQVMAEGECTFPEPGDYMLNRTHGPSPLLAKVNLTTIAKVNVGGPCSIYWQVFPRGADGLPCVSQPPPFQTELCFGGTFQQSFRLVMHEFHGYLPPPLWRFSSDGDPPGPPTLFRG